MCWNNWNNWDNWNNWENWSNVSPTVNANPTNSTSFTGDQNATYLLSGVNVAFQNGYDEVTNAYGGVVYYQTLYAQIVQANVEVLNGSAQEALNFNFGSSGYTASGGNISLNGTVIGTYTGAGTSDLTVALQSGISPADYATILSDITYSFSGSDPGALTGGPDREIQVTVAPNYGGDSIWDEYVNLIPGTFGGALSGGIFNSSNGTNHPFESTGVATFANPDGASAFVGGKIAGAHGVLLLQADGSWDYVLNPNDAAAQALGIGQTLSEVFQVKATDGATSAITITIEGSLAIYGTSANDTINGNGSYIVAGTGNETLNAVSGNNTLVAGSGKDILNGGPGDDILVGGTGIDKINGGSGNDIVYFTNDLKLADQIHGGTGHTTLVLDGDYSKGFTFGATTIVNIQDLELVAGNSYRLTTNDANVASGQTMTVDGSTLLATDSLTFNGAKETDGNFVFIGGAGTNVFTGGAGTNVFDMQNGGIDTLLGGAGNDTFNMGALLTSTDKIDGGGGNNTVVLDGDYSAGLKFGMKFLNIETVSLTAGFSYKLTTMDVNVAAGQTMTIDGSALGAGNILTFTGSAEKDGTLVMLGGAGNDSLTGGLYKDTFDGGAGADKLISKGGIDTFVYNAASDSTSTAYDDITGFNAAKDFFQLPFAVTAVDATVTSGTLNKATFDQNLASAVGAAQLGANHAVLFTPTAGSLHGDTFLIIDTNGVAGYQAGQDLVIELTGSLNLANLSTSDFTT